jgi:hypothetical protein
VQLHAVDKEKPMKKLVGQERKIAEGRGEEQHSVAILRERNDLVVGEDDLHGFREKTHLLLPLSDPIP